MISQERLKCLIFLAGLQLVEPLPAQEPKSMLPSISMSVKAVRLPSNQLARLGRKVARSLNRSPEEYPHPIALSPIEVKEMATVLGVPEAEASVLCNRVIPARIGESARFTIGQEPIYFVAPVKEELYTINAVVGPGVDFEATPVLQCDEVMVSINVTMSKLIRRLDIPGAPGLQAGFPKMDTLEISTQILMSDGITYLMPYATHRESVFLLFMSAEITRRTVPTSHSREDVEGLREH